MRVEIIHNEKDSKERPTGFIHLEEVKSYHDEEYPGIEKEHYGSDWFAEVDEYDLGSFLVGIHNRNKEPVSFFKCRDGVWRVWIGYEE